MNAKQITDIAISVMEERGYYLINPKQWFRINDYVYHLSTIKELSLDDVIYYLRKFNIDEIKED